MVFKKLHKKWSSRNCIKNGLQEIASKNGLQEIMERMGIIFISFKVK